MIPCYVVRIPLQLMALFLYPSIFCAVLYMKLCLYFGNFLSIESNLAVPRCGFLRSSESLSWLWRCPKISPNPKR